MEPSLTQFYDDLKNRTHPAPPLPPKQYMPGPNPREQPNPSIMAWKHKVFHHGCDLSDKCRKHILLDIYAKVLPLDQDYIDGHQGQMSRDIDCMLDKKGMTPTQYLTSCYEATQAPFVKYIIRATDKIGQRYVEATNDEEKKAEEENLPVNEPDEPNVEDDDVQEQLVDIKKDTEYKDFVETLKKKTVKKIVSDISNIINSKKEEDNMTFDTHEAPVDQNAAAPAPAEPSAGGENVAQESVIGVGLDWAYSKLIKENRTLTPEQEEEMIGMCIREATLHQLDVVFEQPGRTFREYRNNIRLGKGYILNESAVKNL